MLLLSVAQALCLELILKGVAVCLGTPRLAEGALELSLMLVALPGHRLLKGAPFLGLALQPFVNRCLPPRRKGLR